MLRAYGPGCDGSIIEAKAEQFRTARPGSTLRSRRGKKSAGRALHPHGCADRERNGGDRAVEPPLRARRRALHDGQRAVGVEDGEPSTTPISFVLADNRLVTVRYATPKPVRAFMEHARREPELARTRHRAGPDARCDHRPACRRTRGCRRATSSKSPRTSFTSKHGRPANPGRPVDGAADPDRPDPDPARQDPLFGGQHQPDAELPRRRQPLPRGAQVDARHHIASLTTDVTR